MKKNTLLIGLVFGLLLVGSALAVPSKHQSSSTSQGMKMSGTIVSSTSSELVLSSKSNGKAEQETFVVNPQTKTKGTLTSGERATVHYKNENGQKVATMISAQTKTATATSTSTSKTK